MKTKIINCVLIIQIALISCSNEDEPFIPVGIDVRQEMRDFVTNISAYAKFNHPDFLVIPQNGIELIAVGGEEESPLDTNYLNAIDGNGQEDLFYGYTSDNQATPANDNLYLISFLDKAKNKGKTILVTDYCSTISKMDDSYNQNHMAGYISFTADNRELSNIPTFPFPIYNENDNMVTTLDGVQNFLYLINPENFNTKSLFISAITATNYDLLIMDLFSFDGEEFTASEIAQLKDKVNGGKRLVIAYMSIGEAEDYRYYWQSNWNSDKPFWLGTENPNWVGNFKVFYWEQEWQNIIYGGNNAYLDKILNANFDGVYLDLIDAFEYYE